MTPEERAKKLARGLDLRRRMMQGMRLLGDSFLEQELARDIDMIADVLKASILEEREACAKLVEAHAIPGAQHDLCLTMGDVIRNARGEVKK